MIVRLKNYVYELNQVISNMFDDIFLFGVWGGGIFFVLSPVNHAVCHFQTNKSFEIIGSIIERE